MKKIIFIHDGLAFYPSMLASKKFFSNLGYIVKELRREEIKENDDFSDCILWLMMGFYPKPIAKKSLAVIHEYRSLSLGRGKWMKDYLKKILNHRPSYRIFQSEKIRKILNRNDGVPYGILSLGVSSDILSFKIDQKKENKKYDFCYVGAINKDREINKMLDRFLQEYQGEKTIVLIGDVKDDIENEYCNHKNIIFTGRVPQEAVYGLVNQSEFAISYVPDIAPYCDQPPTKLYEYAALGCKIIVNDSRSNTNEIDKFGIKAYVMENGHFPKIDVLKKIADNSFFDPTPLYFDSAIVNSGVVEFLEKVV